jgi:uncharacterized protein (TIGR03086 family)
VDEVALLAGVMGKTADLVADVRPEHVDRPTPCSEWDVGALVEHLVGWVQVFDAAANGRAYDGDPGSYRLADDAAKQFRASARSLVEGWRTLGTDRTVRMTGSELPAPMVLNMTLMEYATHGWDLATALGRQAPFTDEEAQATLARARATLQPKYRGPGTAMGEPLAVPDDASPLSQLVAFMGRRP